MCVDKEIKRVYYGRGGMRLEMGVKWIFLIVELRLRFNDDFQATLF